MKKSVFIQKRFCGPPTTGNGGYSSAQVAELVGDSAECTLRKPIPIERELTAESRLDGGAVLLDGSDVIIDCALMPADFDFPQYFPLQFAEALDPKELSPAFHNHPFPTCFTCGPDRAEGDGLRIFPCPVTSSAMGDFWVAVWRPAAEFADGVGHVRPDFIWAAMDCPTGFAAGFPYEGKLVTGRLGVALTGDVRAGEPHVIVSRKTGADGRKHHASAALYDAKGGLKAKARATWIKIDS